MPASIGVNMRVTGHYSQGGRLYMEDKFSVAYQQTEDERDLEYAYFGIFDGHGGSEAAAYAKDHLMEAIVRQRHFWSDDDADVLRAIRNGYMMTHMNMWKELEKWPKVIHGLPSTAGTTASVAFIRRGKIYIGHVGDSAIVLGYQVEGKEEWCAKPLTMDHKPESAAEMQRIQSSGGKVVPKSGIHRVVWNRFVSGGGKLRREEIPFLAIARSLGDHWSYNNTTDEFVVSPDPDVGVLTIDPAKFRCLIFGTDGLWNMISPKMAVYLVQQAQKHNEKASLGACSPDSWLNPSKILVDNAIDRWANTKVRADNTSVVTVMMDPPGPPRSRAPVAPSVPRHPVNSSLVSNDPEQSNKSNKPEPPLCFPTDRVPGKSHTDTNMSQNTIPKMPPAEINTPNPVAPLPSMSNLHQYTRTPHLNLPLHNTMGVQQEKEYHVITNYGNPAESYFIARLLNKTQIKNCLQNVYEEIMKASVEIQDQQPEELPNNNNNNNNTEKCTNKKLHITSPDPETPLEKVIDSSFEENTKNEMIVENESARTENEESKPEETSNLEQESIQINEVSSSSPITAPPKPRKRKSKSLSKAGSVVPQFPTRNLRSNDTTQVSSLRPQTRLASDKSRSNCANSADSNVQKKPIDSKVPVPVHFLKSTTSSNKISILQSKPKNLQNSSIATKNTSAKQETKKIVEKNIVKPQKSSSISKQNEKLDVKNKSTPSKFNDGNVNFSRITRSKDAQSPSTEPVANDPNLTKKSYSNQDLDKTATNDVQPKGCVRNIITRQKPNDKTNGNVESFFTNKTVGAMTTRRNRDQNLGSNPECYKENMLNPVCVSPRPTSLNSVKRRSSSGGTCDLEPKEKRRTRLGDKNNQTKNIQEQHEDVTSTESIKETDFMMGLSTCNNHDCVTEASVLCHESEPTFADMELTDKLKTRNKKDTKCLKNNILSNEISNEVHSTTLHIESECSPTKLSGDNKLTIRSLRPRHDVSITEKKTNLKSEKRVLRSNNCISELMSSTSKLSEKDSRPILRSRNSVGSLPSKNTPRRRVPWPQTLRHNLRKRFSK